MNTGETGQILHWNQTHPQDRSKPSGEYWRKPVILFQEEKKTQVESDCYKKKKRYEPPIIINR